LWAIFWITKAILNSIRIYPTKKKQTTKKNEEKMIPNSMDRTEARGAIVLKTQLQFH